MKRGIFAVVVLLVTAFTGCAAYYGNETQYDKGDWYLFANSREVARIKRDKLALEKLDAQSSLVSRDAATKGFKVIVANMNHYRPINTKLFGPETGSYLLPPDTSEEVYLLPGIYTAVSYDGGNIVGKWTFEVGPPIKKFMGKEVYGYTYYK